MTSFKQKKIFLCVAVIALVVCSLFAGCAKKVTLKFVTFDDEFVEIVGKAGEAVEFPTVDREGYEFDGWYRDESFSGEAATEAVFDTDTTYFAKWQKTYAITFDLDGGSLGTMELFLKEGASIFDAVKDLEPTKGDCPFGGWYIGDEKLTGSDKMPASGVTLTARYKAAYSVDVYLQDLNLIDYSLEIGYETGYALIEEEFSPEISVVGFTQRDDGETTLIIDENADNNVFVFRFDRNEYSLWFVSNYPEESGQAEEEIAQTYLYGEEISFPETVNFATEGYRFFGWGERFDSDFDEAVSAETFSLEADTILYAIWNKGYTDMFAGEDYIFLLRDGSTKAILNRGGVDIEGRYNEKKDWYEFASQTTNYVLNARVNDNGTFIFYANRKGEYFMFRPTGIDKEITLALDDMNGIEYYCTTEGNKRYLEGEYVIDENGYYVANFDDGSGFTFLLGRSTDPSSGETLQVFRVRGEEANWGVLPFKAVYYPTVELDGFGYALFTEQAGRSAYVSYVIEGDIFMLYDTASRSEIFTARVGDYSGNKGYEFYDAKFDKTYTHYTAELKLDGCSTAIFSDGIETFMGNFSVKNSLFGGYIITVTSTSGQTRMFLVTETQVGTQVVSDFEEKHVGYAEYLYVSNDGSLSGYPVFVDNGDGTAEMYEKNDQNELEWISSGNLTAQGNVYLYTVTEQAAVWTVEKFIALVLNFDTQSSSYDVYYWISYDDGENVTDWSTTYVGQEGSVLTIVSCFVIYEDGKGGIISGVFTQGPDFIKVSQGDENHYFELSDSDKTFVKLAYEPTVLIMKKDGKTVSTSTLTVSGRTTTEGNFEAVFAEKSGEGSIGFNGYFTLEEVATVGVNVAVYTFKSEGKTFKFTLSASSTTLYFHYFELSDIITFGYYEGLNDSDEDLPDSKLSLTDEKDADDNYLVVYSSEEKTTKGTFTSREVVSFNKYNQTVYTFTAIDGETTFDFTLIGSYFRICAPTTSYSADDGSTLELDGVTHMAKYFDTRNEVFGYYVVTTNVLDKNETAVSMSINDVMRSFDLKSHDNTFMLRGLEEGAYLKVENNMPDGEVIEFDGHGNAVLNKPDDTKINASYASENGVYTITFEGGSYVGETGVFVLGDKEYYAFLFFTDGIAGSYLDSDDLSVLKLDQFGNATRYNSSGLAEKGRYTVISENLVYFETTSGSAALYTYDCAGKITRSTFSATYYADDFASVVFYSNGVVLFNNSDATYFCYDEKAQKIYTFTPSDSEAANPFGFEVKEFLEDNGSITYTDPDTGVTRRYNRFDGKHIVLNNVEGGTLEFQPDGNSEFTVASTYIDSEGKKTSYYFLVYYDENKEVKTLLAEFRMDSLNGSISNYRFTVNYSVEVNLTDKTFGFDKDNHIFGLTAYDYTYMELLSTYGSGLAFMFEGAFGYLNIKADVVDGKIGYSVSGSFNFIKGTDNNIVSFVNGSLSGAGYINPQVEEFGNMFTSEFTGSDGELYHLNFYIAYNSKVQEYVYVIHSCTRVKDMIEIDGDTKIFREVFLYSSAFRFVKTTDPSTGEATSFYVLGDDFYPTLKYKGEMICTHNFFSIGENKWVFYSREYRGKNYTDYRYYFNFVTDEDGNIDTGTILRRVEKSYVSALGDTAYVLCDEKTGEIVEIVGLTVDNEFLRVTACVDNGNDTFIVTTVDGTYLVTVHKKADGTFDRISIEKRED